MSIFSKGLLLISIPLLLQLISVSLTTRLMAECKRQVEQEIESRDRLAIINSLMVGLAQSGESAFLFCITRSQKVAADQKSAVRRLIKKYKEFEQSMSVRPEADKDLQLLKKNLIATFRTQSKLMSLSQDRNIRDFMNVDLSNVQLNPATVRTSIPLARIGESEERLSRQRAESREKLTRQIATALLTCLVLNISLSIFLSLAWVASMRSRLTHVMRNTRLLALRRALAPPVGGSDELGQMDAALYRAGHDVLDLERFKDQMAGVVVRQLQYPFEAISNCVQDLLAGRCGQLPAEANRMLVGVGDNIARLMRLVKEFLEVEKVKSGRLELSIAPVRLGEIIESSVSMLGRLAEAKGIAIKTSYMDTSLAADSDRLVQVLVNLIGNAIKFSPPGATVTVAGGRLSEGLEVELKVSDIGPGIPPDQLEAIFERFKQVSLADARQRGGSGLGLAIAKMIVEAHGGTITVESRIAQGSTFRLRIPVEAHLSTATDLIPKASPGGSPPRFSLLHRGLVLVIVPLLYGMTFTGGIFLVLKASEKVLLSDIRSREVVRELNITTGALVLASTAAGIYNLYQVPAVLEGYKNSEAEVRAALDRLEKHMLSDQTEADIYRKLERSVQQTLAALSKIALSPPASPEIGTWIQEVGQTLVSALDNRTTSLIDNTISYEIQLQRMRSKRLETYTSALKYVVVGGIVVNLVLCLALVWWFSGSVNKRIKNVVENARRLRARQLLLPAVGGNDEIGDLDLSFHKTASDILELESYKEQVIGIVGHELRTPLTAITGTLKLVGAGALGALSNSARVSIQAAEAEGDYLIRLINDLLDIERLNAGRFQFASSDVALAELLDACALSISQAAQEKGVMIDVAQTEEHILTDRECLMRVITNLLERAVQLSRPGSALKVQTLAQAGSIELSISGRGAGDAQLLTEEIFEPFSQAAFTERPAKAGTGLEMAVIKAIIEKQGGAVGVKSPGGATTVFWAKLPAAPGLQPAAA